MHPTRSQHPSERPQNEGSVAAYFGHTHNLIQTNDSTKSFSIKTIDCHDHKHHVIKNLKLN